MNNIKSVLQFMLIIICQQSFSIEVIAKEKYFSENGDFSIICHNQSTCLLKIKDKTILSNLSYDNESVVNEISKINLSIYLLKIYQGDGCPSMYKLLHLLNDNKYHISEAFGNCNEYSELSSNVDMQEVNIWFPSLDVSSRQAITYKYAINHQKLEMCDNCDKKN